MSNETHEPTLTENLAESTTPSSPHGETCAESRSPRARPVFSPPDCDWCGDTGTLAFFSETPNAEPVPVRHADWIDFRWSHPGWLESMAVCPCQEAKRRQVVLDRLFGDGSPKAVYRNFTFESWDALPLEDRLGKIEARDLCGQFALGALDISGERRIGLVLAGPTGTTKSSLASQVLLARTLRGEQTLWVQFWEILDRVKATYKPGSERTYGEVIEALASVQFLMIDDLGPGRGVEITPHVRNVTWSLINERYSRLLPTIITTNLGWTEFVKAFDEALAYRITQLYHWQAVGGKNLRKAEG